MPTLISDGSWADLPGVSIATNSEVVGLGVRALLTPVLSEVWRTGSVTVRTLDVDLGALREVRAVVLQAPRDGLLPAPGDTVTAILSAVTMGNTDAGSFSGSLAMPVGYWAWVLPAAVTARYLRLRFTSSQPYLQFGRLWVGTGMWTERFLSESGYGPATFDETAQPTRRRIQFEMPQLSQDQADQLEDIGLRVGTQRQVLAIPRTERAARTAVIGKLTAIPAPKPRQAWSQGGLLHTATLTVQEDR
jgi:hypothetical protein